VIQQKQRFISEVGDIEKFESKEKFVSYIGLDPVIHQVEKAQNTGNIEKRE